MYERHYCAPAAPRLFYVIGFYVLLDEHLLTERAARGWFNPTTTTPALPGGTFYPRLDEHAGFGGALDCRWRCCVLVDGGRLLFCTAVVGLPVLIGVDLVHGIRCTLLPQWFWFADGRVGFTFDWVRTTRYDSQFTAFHAHATH